MAIDSQIHFLTLEELEAIHDFMGGQVPQAAGSVHEGVLRACLSTPANKMGGKYLHQDIFEMAAAYLFHITDQRPFKTNNAKTAALAALFFLYLHSQRLTAPPDELAALVDDIAQGKATKLQAASFLRKNCAPEV